MRVFVWFLIGIGLSVGDKLDRTYLPPPGSKLSGGSDGDLQGPLDYPQPTPQAFIPGKTQFGSQRTEQGSDLEGKSPDFTQIKPAPGSRQPAQLQDTYDQNRQSAKPISFGSKQPLGQKYVEESKEEVFSQETKVPPFELNENGPPQISGQSHNPFSRFPNAETRSKFNLTAPTSSSRKHSTPSRFSSTKYPTHFETTEPTSNFEHDITAEDGESYPYRQQPTNTKIAPSIDANGAPLQDVNQSDEDFGNDSQRSYKSSGKLENRPKYTENFPQEEERNFYRQGTQSTIRPSTFSPRDQTYYPSSKTTEPSQKFDISRSKSGRPTFGAMDSVRPSVIQYNGINNFDQSSIDKVSTEAQEIIRDFEFDQTSTEEYGTSLPTFNKPNSPFAEEQGQDFNQDNLKYRPADNVNDDTLENGSVFETQQPASNYKQISERPFADNDRNAVIINYTNDITPEGYFAYSYDTSNGIHADKNGTAADGVKAQGGFSYTGDDGKFYSIIYTADENGFNPKGDHLPTPPPIPEAILRVIEQAHRDKEAGISNDGSYDEKKYGYKKYSGATAFRPQNDYRKKQNGMNQIFSPVNQQSQEEIDSIANREFDTDDSKDYLDVENVDENVDSQDSFVSYDKQQYPSRSFTKKPATFISNTENMRPGVLQKQVQYDSNTEQDQYYQPRDKQFDIKADDVIQSKEDQTFVSTPETYSTEIPVIVQNKYESSRRGPVVYEKENKSFNGFSGASDNNRDEKPIVQEKSKVVPSKVQNNFESKNRRPSFDTNTYDSTERANVDESTPYITENTYNIARGPNKQAEPRRNQDRFPRPNQDRFSSPKFTQISESVAGINVDSDRDTPLAQQGQAMYYESRNQKERYPTQPENKPTNVKVDAFGKIIPTAKTEDEKYPDFEDNKNVQYSTERPTYDVSSQKTDVRNKNYQKPIQVNQYQESGYDYIPPRNKFIQESNRIPSKYSNVQPSDIPSVDKGVVGGLQKAIYQETYKSTTILPTYSETTISSSDDEFDFQKEYPKFGQEPERKVVISPTFAKRPTYTFEPKMNIQSTESTPFPGNSKNDDRRPTEDEYNSEIEFTRIGQNQPAQRPIPSRQYSQTSSRPVPNLGTRRPNITRDRVPSTTYRPVFSVAVTDVTFEPTVFEDNRYSTETAVTPGTYEKHRTGSGNYYRTPVNKSSSRSRPDTEVNKFGISEPKTYTEDSQITVEAAAPTRDENLNAYLPDRQSNKLTGNAYRKPVNTFSSTSRPEVESSSFDEPNEEMDSLVETKFYDKDDSQKIDVESSYRKPRPQVSRFDTAKIENKNHEPKVIGEDFSGPQHAQYHDETGYHY